ncbi:glycoside hydrolase family 28 protein [Ruminococcaceae bacterium OttesenSCG-928-A16]|nr:glycoside hydrolase family 28 protein [Ruminococcaceae bacterium OttesenSCG-928-A16]
MINLTELAVLQRAATLELIQDEPTIYYAPGTYTVFLNGQLWQQGNTNVFSLFGLQPSMYYEARVQFENGQQAVCNFITPAESMVADVTQFGAVGDGKTDCTSALQAAISACLPGGTVYVPAGTYYTYPLFLKSNTLLYLEKGATLLAGSNRSRYPILPGMVKNPADGTERSFGTWEGNPLDSYASLITAIDGQNVAIAGEGVLDGNAAAAQWWVNPKIKKGAWRPRTVFCVRCTGLTLLGITAQNSPSWTIHPYYCTNVDILNITLKNPPDSPNTDGCNPDCCQNVRIIGAAISVGDDCISVKSGKYYMAKYHHAASRNIVVRNCLLQRGHGAVVLGSEVSGGVDGLRVQQCLMKNTDRGLRIKTRRGRGASSVIANIEFAQIAMENVQTPFVINMFYFCDPDGHSDYVKSKQPLPVNELTPTVQSLYCHHITCTGAQYAGVFFYALPERPVQNIRLENVSIAFDENATPGLPAMMDDLQPVKKVALFAANIQHLALHNVHFAGQQGETYQLENVQKFENTL